MIINSTYIHVARHPNSTSTSMPSSEQWAVVMGWEFDHATIRFQHFMAFWKIVLTILLSSLIIPCMNILFVSQWKSAVIWKRLRFRCFGNTENRANIIPLRLATKILFKSAESPYLENIKGLVELRKIKLFDSPSDSFRWSYQIHQSYFSFS